MKIINNRVVCSGCEEPFEVGQKYLPIIKPFVTVDVIMDHGGTVGYPSNYMDVHADKIQLFHEGCD